MNGGVEHVPGKNAGHVMLYALSTCGWCARTRKLLDDLGIAYDYEYVDQLSKEERERAMGEVERWNPSRSFPTLVIGNQTCVVGYKEDEIRRALKL